MDPIGPLLCIGFDKNVLKISSKRFNCDCFGICQHVLTLLDPSDQNKLLSGAFALLFLARSPHCPEALRELHLYDFGLLS